MNIHNSNEQLYITIRVRFLLLTKWSKGTEQIQAWISVEMGPKFAFSWLILSFKILRIILMLSKVTEILCCCFSQESLDDVLPLPSTFNSQNDMKA